MELVELIAAMGINGKAVVIFVMTGAYVWAAVSR